MHYNVTDHFTALVMTFSFLVLTFNQRRHYEGVVRSNLFKYS